VPNWNRSRASSWDGRLHEYFPTGLKIPLPATSMAKTGDQAGFTD